jgi:GT2 family glycosyltransferase
LAETGSPPPPVLTAIVVSYNDRENIGRCLSSIRTGSEGSAAEVIVVDNASSDGSPDLVAADFPSVRLIRSTENLGFARANNLAIRRSRGELILFLNTDAALQEGTLAALLAELRRNPRTGIVGPALVNDRGGFQVSFGGRVGFLSELFRKTVLNRYWARRLRRDRTRRKAGWVSGACFLARRRALEAAGFFDEDFFLFFEDIDLCRRVGRAGWEVVFLPEARAFHKGGATTAPRRLRSRLAYRESQILYYRKHASRFSQLLLRLYLRLAFPAEGLRRTPPGAGKPGGRDRSGGRPAKGERR